MNEQARGTHAMRSSLSACVQSLFLLWQLTPCQYVYRYRCMYVYCVEWWTADNISSRAIVDLRLWLFSHTNLLHNTTIYSMKFHACFVRLCILFSQRSFFWLHWFDDTVLNYTSIHTEPHAHRSIFDYFDCFFPCWFYFFAHEFSYIFYWELAQQTQNEKKMR